jgi:hypothetical protein
MCQELEVARPLSAHVLQVINNDTVRRLTISQFLVPTPYQRCSGTSEAWCQLEWFQDRISRIFFPKDLRKSLYAKQVFYRTKLQSPFQHRHPPSHGIMALALLHASKY